MNPGHCDGLNITPPESSSSPLIICLPTPIPSLLQAIRAECSLNVTHICRKKLDVTCTVVFIFVCRSQCKKTFRFCYFQKFILDARNI